MDRPALVTTFTLVAPGSATVDTETVTVTGNGTYTTPTGFTLPPTGPAGVYQNGAAIDALVTPPLPADDLAASLLWLARTQGF